MRWTKRQLGLDVRIILLLSLALLPLGAIAIYQAARLSTEAREQADKALIALTEQATFRERQVIERTLGASYVLQQMLLSIQDQPDLCQQYLSGIVGTSTEYSFVGFWGADGIMRCSSVSGDRDLSDMALFTKIMDDQRVHVVSLADAPISETDVLSVLSPVYDGDALAGYVVMSIPKVSIAPENDPNVGIVPLALLTLNGEGEVLTFEGSVSDIDGMLPAGRDLSSLLRDQAHVFKGVRRDRQHSNFAIIPIQRDLVYALGVWQPDLPLLTDFRTIGSTVLISLIMWIASILVAYFAMHRLVIAGLNQLSQTVRRFTLDRQLTGQSGFLKGELLELDTTFRQMAETIVQDEAALEDAVFEKQVLLKEVHHRVKNNLQLISSIMNMQLRKAVSEETKTILRRLQERVMALASIHKSLYLTGDTNTLDASEIVRHLIGQSMTLGRTAEAPIDVKTDLEPVILFPDQAVPLSLLISEALTNALKYIGGQNPYLSVSLRLIDRGRAEVRITNKLGDETSAKKGTGVGSQLITAFVQQLEGKLTTHEQADAFCLIVSFPVEDFRDEIPVDRQLETA